MKSVSIKAERGSHELGFQMYIKWLVLALGLESSPLRMKGRKGGGREGGREGERKWGREAPCSVLCVLFSNQSSEQHLEEKSLIFQGHPDAVTERCNCR